MTFIVTVIVIISLNVSYFNNPDVLDQSLSKVAKLKHLVFDKTSFKKSKVVFLVSQCRSGSSILGELFNQRTNVSYLYEPLYPFREKNCVELPKSLKESSVEALNAMTKCNFTKLQQLYKKAFHFTKQADNAGCLSNKICFSTCNKCSKFLKRDAKSEKLINSRGFVYLDKLNSHCKKSLFFAAKLNYLRGVESIAPLVNSNEVETKVIILLRDPRAILKSLLKARGISNPDLNYIKKEAEIICNRLEKNTLYKLQSQNSRIIIVKHEEFSLQPIFWTEKIYKFIGFPPTTELINWVNSATSGGNSNDQFGTKRDSFKVINSWRNSLSFEQVDAVQGVCNLDLLRYKVFDSETELRNLKTPSFQPFN